MEKRRHILLSGEVGVGKSTLIRRLLTVMGLPLYGFVTKSLSRDRDASHPIYIHPAAQPETQRSYTAENLVGICNRREHTVNPDAFNLLGVRLLQAAQSNGVTVMDELGFLEAQASDFTRTVFSVLDNGAFVLAAVKSRYDVAFLNQVRAHPRADVYTVTVENRDALYEALLPLLPR